MLEVNHANIAALAERGSMLAIAKAMSGHWGVNIIPSGTECSTDGKNIYYPYNADHLKDATRQVLHGLLDHEVTHVAEEREHANVGKTTPLAIVKRAKSSTEKMMFNVFEDIRVETKYSVQFPGVAENLNAANLNSVDLFKKRHGANNTNKGHFWHTLGCAIIMKARGYSISWVPTDILPFLNICEPEVKASTKSGAWADHAHKLALRVIKKVEQLGKEIEQEQKQRQEEKKQNEQEGQDGQQEAGQEQKGQQVANEGGQKTKNNEDAQGGDEQDQSKAEDKGEQSGKSGSQPGNEAAKEEKGGNGSASEMSDKELSEAANAAHQSKSDSQYSDMMQMAKDHITQMAEVDARDNRRYLPNKQVQKQDRFVPINTDVADHNTYMRCRDQATSQITGMKSKLLNVIRTSARNIQLHNQTKGKINKRKLHKVLIESDRIFTKTLHGQKLDTAVSILVDMSGSMGNSGNSHNKAAYARLAAIALGETLAALNIPFEIIGFNTPVDQHYGYTRDNNTRVHPMRYYPFKMFNDKFKRVRDKLTQITGGGNNVDGEAVLMVASRLVQRPEQRKILMVLSDGLPRGGGVAAAVLERHLHEVIRIITKKGIEVIGIGIKAQDVGKFYSRKNGAECILIDDLDQLAIRVYKVLRDRLLKGRKAA